MRMGIPRVVCVVKDISERPSSSNIIHKVWFTHIDSQIQQVKRARVRLVPHSNLKLARRDHGHQEIREMKHSRPKDLF